MKCFWVGVLLFGFITGCAGLGLSPVSRDFNKAMGLFDQGQYEEAVNYFKKVIEADPKHGQAHLYLGRSYFNLGQWQRALPPLRTALRIAPKKTRNEAFNVLMDALLRSADSLFKKGQFKEGLSLLREGLHLSGKSTIFIKEALDRLIAFGAEMLHKGNADAAVKAFSEAVKMAPKEIDGYIGLAKAFIANGDALKALETAKRALSLNPSAQEAKKLLDQMTQ